MKYQAVVFDFDYTLGDSTEGMLSCVNHGLGSLGIPLAEREAVRRTAGLSMKDIYRELTGDQEEAKAVLFEIYFRDMADLVMVAYTNLYPDALDLLRSLRDRNIRTGIVTAKYHCQIDAILDKCHGSEYIDMIVGGEDVSAVRPDPEGLLMTLAAWNLPPEQVLYVGDSLVDARTAEAAGVDFAGVTTGTTTREELEKYPYAGVYGSLRELGEAVYG